MNQARTFLILLGLLSASVARADSFSYENLQSLIQNKNVTTVEQLIPLLPAALRTHYTYIYDSQSLQEASFDFPRALLFGEDGKMMLTFNGSPKQKGFNSVEVIQFRDSTRTFEFREITFGASHQSPTFSAADPQKCMQCHTGPGQLGLRPNWSRYPNWPGLYGSNEDELDQNANEQQSYQNFLQNAKRRGRYASLITDPRNPESPYINTSQPTSQVSSDERPNLQLSLILSRLNSLRVARVLESATFAPFQYATLFLASRCRISKADASVLAEINKRGGGKLKMPSSPTTELEQLEKLFTSINLSPRDWDMVYRDEPTSNQADNADPYFYSDGAVTMSDYVAFDLAKDIAKADPAFAAKFKPDGDLILGYGEQTGIDPQLANILHSDGQSISMGLIGTPENASDTNCALFSQTMQAHWVQDGANALTLAPYQEPLWSPDGSTSFLTNTVLSETAQAQLLAHTCSSCHSDGEAPDIPFDDVKSLKPLLNAGKYPRGTLIKEIRFRLETQDPNQSMPRYEDITADLNRTRQTIEKYLNSLAAGK